MPQLVETQFIKGSFPCATQLPVFGTEVKNFNNVLLSSAPVNAVAAAKDFTYFIVTANVKGSKGNAISITLVEREEDGPLIVSVLPDTLDFVVTLEMDSDSSVSIGTDVIAALNAFTPFANVATATGTSTSLVSAATKTYLSGGVDATIASDAGFYYMDDTYLYVALDKNTKTDTNWRRISLGSAY